MRFKIKSKQLKEITDADLGDIKKVLSGNQMPDLFGDTQRFVVDVEKTKSIDDIAKETHEYLLEYRASIETVKEFIKYINSRISNSEGKTTFKLDIENGFLVRNETRTIPKGPKAGETINRDRNFNLSSFVELLDAVSSLMEHKDEVENYSNKSSEFYKDAIKEYETSLERVNNLTDRFWTIFHTINNPDDCSWYFGTEQYYPIETPDEKTNSTNMVILYMADLIQYIDAKAEKYRVYNSGRQFHKPPIKIFKDVLENVVDNSKGRKVIFSRAPIDLARMSDFSQSGIESCHSPGASKFHCALFDAASNGAVAFLVPSDAYEKTADNLQSRDYFKDLQRKIEGPVPIKRIRIRRFYYIPDDVEIGVPELKIYGGGDGGDSFKELVKNICIERQKSVYDKIKSSPNEYTSTNFIFVGGSWSDDAPEELMNNFFGDYVKRPRDMRIPKAAEDSLESGQYNALKSFIKLANLSAAVEDTLLDDSTYEAAGYSYDYDEFILTTKVATVDNAFNEGEDILERFMQNVPNSESEAKRIINTFFKTEANHFDLHEHSIQLQSLTQYFVYLNVSTVLKFTTPNTFSRDILRKIVKHFKICEELAEFHGKSEFTNYFTESAKVLIDASVKKQAVTAQLERLNRRRQITRINNFYRR